MFIDFLKATNLEQTMALSINQEQDFVIHGGEATLRSVQFKLAIRGLEGVAGIAIAASARVDGSTRRRHRPDLHRVQR